MHMEEKVLFLPSLCEPPEKLFAVEGYGYLIGSLKKQIFSLSYDS